jgi:UDP-GlcNAc:undecaprenyl-phosphate GlcNAc-1-phosphate transferase
MFAPDRSHIHHQILARGVSHRNAVLILYAISVTLGISAYAMSVNDSQVGRILLILVAIAILVGIHQLRYEELPIHRNGILLRFYHSFYEWPLMQRSLFQSTVDIIFMTLAYLGAHSLTNTTLVAGMPLFEGAHAPVIMILLIQLSIFWLTGLYRETTRQMGIGDALRVIRSVLFAVIATVFGSLLLFREMPQVTFTIVNFFFLLSLVLTSRFSYSLLTYWLNRDFTGKKRAVIYSANTFGLAVLQFLLESRQFDVVPVGFLDDDPALEGKSLNGYPVYGGHWRLERIIKELGLDVVILPEHTLGKEQLSRLQRISRLYGLEIRKVQIALEHIPLESGTARPAAHLVAQQRS